MSDLLDHIPNPDDHLLAFLDSPDDKQELSFGEWLTQTSPDFHWNWEHLLYIRQHLDQITAGTLKRLIIQCPPRHGKTEMGTIRYPIFRLEQDPTMRIVIAAYSQTLANTFSRKARRFAQELYIYNVHMIIIHRI